MATHGAGRGPRRAGDGAAGGRQRGDAGGRAPRRRPLGLDRIGLRHSPPGAPGADPDPGRRRPGDPSRRADARSHAGPFVGAVVVFLSGYLGLAASFFPYVAPYDLTFRDAANDDGGSACCSEAWCSSCR
ncbi:MAG: hypothetical protein WDM85_19195 [Caulobacteraceae bacterium]